jgi:hypothetical protein
LAGTSPSAALPYLVGSDAPALATYFASLTTALDQKVIVRVADNTSRNALTKYDGMPVMVTSTRRLFRYDATNARWDYLSGPWYTWTPTLIDNGGVAVTGVASNVGEYTIVEGKIRFRLDMVCGAAIAGRAGALRLQLPTGVVGRTSSQSGGVARLYTAALNGTWLGIANLPASASAATLLFPQNGAISYMNPFQNASGPGATGTGIPLISGNYPLVAGSEFSAWGEFALSSWPAL